MDEALKVILNVDAISHPLTGIGQYTQQLGLALNEEPAVQTLRYFSANRWINDLENTATINRWLSRARRWVPLKGLALNAYTKRRDAAFKSLSQNLEDHVLHSPNFVLMPHAGPSVVTIHDLSYVHHRETQPAYRLRYLDQAIPQTLEQAEAVITVSEAVKQEVVSHHGLSPDQVHVTPLGVDPGFHPRNQAACQRSLNVYGLNHKQFILAVATTEPRKNLGRLLNAYEQLPESTQRHFPLVLVGSHGWLNQSLNQRIKQLVKNQTIRSLGYVSRNQLKELYASAQLTAFPSLYEGFGLPIIESLASGTQVLTSNVGAMQEVSHGHALLCNPEDENSILEGLKAGLDQTTPLGFEAIEHAQSHTWQRCSELTCQVYRKIQISR